MLLVVAGLIGAVDFWWDMTKTAPGPDQDAKREALSPRVRQLVAAASEGIAGAGFPASSLDRQREILAMTGDYLDGVLKDGKAPAGPLDDYAKRTSPLMLANADDAARSQIDAYHARVSAWRRELTAEEWSKLHVVILGPQMPHKHNVSVQYFAKLMGLAGEARRLISTSVLWRRGAAARYKGADQAEGRRN